MSAMDEPKTRRKDKTKASNRRSQSAWKRTKLLLTCNSCHGNDSDSEPYCPSDICILDVPLCSGDKAVDLAMVASSSVNVNQEDMDVLFDSDDYLEQYVLSKKTSSKKNENAIDKWQADLCATGHEMSLRSVEVLTAEREECKLQTKNAMRRGDTPLPERRSVTILDEAMEVEGRNNINNEFEVMIALHEVKDITPKDTNISEMVDHEGVSVMEEACDICKAEKLKSTGKRDETESENSGEKTYSPEKELLEKLEIVEIHGELSESTIDTSAISEREQPCESTPTSSVNADSASNCAGTEMPVKQLAVPLRYVLGTGEAHILPDVEEAEIIGEDVAESGEGLVQEFLQEVISERELIAMRVEVINDLLTRECHSEEFIEEAPTQVEEVDVDDSNVSLEVVASRSLESRDILSQTPVEDASLGAVIDTTCKTGACTNAEVAHLNLRTASLTLENLQCEPDISESASVDVISKDTKSGKEIGDEKCVILKESTEELSEEAKEVTMMNVFYDELGQETGDILPSSLSEVCKGDEIVAENAAIHGDANPEVAIALKRKSTVDVVIECKEASPSAPLVVDFQAADTTSTSSRRGGNQHASQEVIQIAQEIVDPMLAHVARVFCQDLPLASMPSLAFLTDAVVNVPPTSSECFKSFSSDNSVDALLAATETTESALADLGEVSRRCLEPTSSVTDLDALLDALETTEMTLANLEEASSDCVQSMSNKKESNNETSKVETELTISNEESGLRYLESLSLDKDVAAPRQETETTQTSVDTMKFSESTPTDKVSSTSLSEERLSIWDLDTSSSRFLRRLRYTDKYLSVPLTDEKLSMSSSSALSLDCLPIESTDIENNTSQDEAESAEANLTEEAPEYLETTSSDKDISTSFEEIADKDLSASLEDAESTILAEETSACIEPSPSVKDPSTTLEEIEPTILGEEVRGCLETTSSVKDLVTSSEDTADKEILPSLEEIEPTILGEAPSACPELISSDKDLSASLEDAESTMLAEEASTCIESTSSDKDRSTSLEEIESTILGEETPGYLGIASSDKDLLTTFGETEPTILVEAPQVFPESESDDEDLLTSVEETECMILAEASPGYFETTLSDDDFASSLEPTDSCCSKDCAISDVCEDETEQPNSVQTTESSQLASSSDDLAASLTSLETASLADLTVDRATSSLIELTRQPSLTDLMPTPSLMCLATPCLMDPTTPSDDSILDASPTSSTEEAGMKLMATASNSAEWPDQGKEQHRSARENKKRNKKRNRRNKK